jgi:hypothetical protein
MFFYLFFFYKDFYLPILDYLDGPVPRQKVSSQNINFFDPSYLVPNFLNGYQFNYFVYNEFHLINIIYSLVKVNQAEVFIQFLGRFLIFIYSYKYFLTIANHRYLSLFGSTIILMSEFSPIFTFSLLSAVFSLYYFSTKFINLTNFDKFILLAIPFLYSFIYGGMFASIIILGKLLKEKKILVFFSHSLFILLTNYRLFYQFIYGEETIRKLYIEYDLDIAMFIQEFIYVNLKGDWWMATSMRYIILPMVIVYILKNILSNKKDENIQNLITIFFIIQIINIVYILFKFNLINTVEIFGSRINFGRVLIFNHFLWIYLLILILNYLTSDKIEVFGFFFVLIILTQFFTNETLVFKMYDLDKKNESANVVEQATSTFAKSLNASKYYFDTFYNIIYPGFGRFTANYSTISEYYLEDSFNLLKKDKSISEMNFMSINIDPMIAAYNGLNISDGYYTQYSLEYHDKFSKVIEKELMYLGKESEYFTSWGNRLYLFQKFGSKKLENINFCLLSEFGVTNILSNENLDSEFLINDLKYGDIINFKVDYSNCA